MSPSVQSPASAPLPPLPDLQSASGTGGQPGGGQDAMAAIMSGITPVKTAVDGIVAACRSIVQSGAVPGAEQPCAQIVAIATSLLPMALQQALQPGQGGGAGIQGMPPPGGPPPAPAQ